jgi:hypothetical protein
MTERAVLQTPIRSLDLRVERELRQLSRPIQCAGGGSVTHSPPLRLPLRITINPLNADRYSISDRFAYTLRLKNVADVSVTVPWSERLQVPCNGRESLQAWVALWFTDPSGGVEVVDGAGGRLVGIVGDPTTVLTLQPGQEATLTVPGRWAAFSTSAIRTMVKQGGGAVLRVHARLYVEERMGRAHDAIVSDNEITVSVSPP